MRTSQGTERRRTGKIRRATIEVILYLFSAEMFVPLLGRNFCTSCWPKRFVPRLDRKKRISFWPERLYLFLAEMFVPLFGRNVCTSL